MLKISCFVQNQCNSGMPQGIPMQIFPIIAESLVVVTSFTNIHSGLQQYLFFKFFNSWKVLKMLKISCFVQNQCISGMPQGIPMQFFAQHWGKSCCCDQFHKYSQWFAAKFNFLNFSIAGNCSKCLNRLF